MPHNTKPCRPGQLCRNWRACPTCAALRQAKTADKAEALHLKYGQLYLSVITPHQNNAIAIRRMRAALLRHSFAPAGIWTIETGEKFNHLHLNTITPYPTPPGLDDATIHTELIKTSPRAVAAYITKRIAAPSAAQYTGHLLGSWGQIGQYMTTSETEPVIQAAAINDLLSTPLTRMPYHFSFCPEANPNTEIILTPSEYKEIAKRNLSALYAAVQKQQAAPYRRAP